jgi:HK97 family phage prohead protease
MDSIVVVKSSVSPLRVKAFDIKEGIIKAYVTTWGNEDLVGDIIAEGAADKFIEGFNKKGDPLKMLFEHAYDKIIGQWNEFEADAKGLLATGELYKGVSKADDVKIYLEKGAIGAVSIGFMSKAYTEIEETGGRLFEEIDIFETSIVISPANPQAQIVSAKNDEGQIDIRELEKILRDVGFSNNLAKRFISAGKQALRDGEIEPVEIDVRANLIKLMKEGKSNG